MANVLFPRHCYDQGWSEGTEKAAGGWEKHNNGDPLSQVNYQMCVHVCVCEPNKSEPKPDSNHQNCTTCVCDDSDSNNRSIWL